jgi:hypothetical protein
VSEWSATEVLREKSFRAYTSSDRELARAELRRLAATIPQRPSARRRRAAGRGSQLDLRRTMRAAVRHGGDPEELNWRRRRPQRRRLVFVCDVSGSMAPFAAVGLEYVHAVLRAGARAEAFCFGTRLTRVTAELRAGDATTALAAAEAKAVDRAGGTRIGAAISALNREHRHRLGRGAVVVILSDGWERGEPELVAREMERLSRLAHRIVWVNPRVSANKFAPRTGGMAAALPFVDAFVSGHSFEALEEVVEAIGGSTVHSPQSAESEPDMDWASATPVQGSSVAMPSGHGPSRGNTTPGWVTDE